MNATKPNRNAGGRYVGVFLLLMAAVLLSAPRATAGTVSVTGYINGNYNSLTDAAWQVNNNKGAGRQFVIAISSDQSGLNNTINPGDNFSWNIHGMDNAEDYNPPAGIPGFGAITVRGTGTAQMVLTGNGSTGVLKVLHASSAITIDNLKITGGNLTSGASTFISHDEIGGGGMMLGSSGGLGTTPNRAPQTITVSTVDVENNQVNLDASSGASNAYGGGIYVSGVGGAGLPDPSAGHSNVTFSAVNLRNNSVEYTKGVSGDASVRGGGARIGYANSFSYTNGTVQGNSVVFLNGDTGDHASGGGLSVDGHEVAATGANINITLSNVKFNGNSVTMSGSGGEARGGGFYYLGANNSTVTRTVSFDSLTEFENNIAIGSPDGISDWVSAQGGGVYVALNDAHAVFNETRFLSNVATTQSGDGLGGAIMATKLYTTNAALGNLTVTGAYFQGNLAQGTQAGGGAVFADVGAANTLTDNTFLSNSAIGDYYASGGAIYHSSASPASVHNLSGNVFERNVASTTGYGGDASGGAVTLSQGSYNLDNTEFINNSAEAVDSAGIARGGALNLVATTTVDLNNATFTENKARGGVAALGGAIYLYSGTVNLENATLTNNQAIASVASDARGGAIYANTSSITSSVINLSTSGESDELLISGNRAGGYASGIHFGVDPYSMTNAKSQSDARLNISGAGKVSILDPITVDMNNVKNFYMTKTGEGTLVWGGTNTFTTVGGTSYIDIQEGLLSVTDTFTARGQDSLGNLSGFDVNIGSDVTIEFSISRNQNVAMFDFANSGTKNVNVGPGATLTTSLGREIISQTWKFAIIKGASDDQLNAAMNNFDFVQTGNLANILDLSVEGDTLYAMVQFNSPFDNAGVNPTSALNGLDSLVHALGDKMSDEEYMGILNNPYGVTPELYMDQAAIMVKATGMVARSAVDYGARTPHRMRLRMQNRPVYEEAYETYEAYEDCEEVEVYESRGSYRSYQSYEAYPSMATCTNESGLRLWANYLGDYDRRDTHGGYQGYKVERHGFLIGLAYDFGLSGTVGVYGGYTSADSNSRQSDQQNKADNGHFGAIARVSPITMVPEFSIYADGGYHFAYNDLTRNLGGYMADSSYDQDVWTAGLGLEYLWMVGNSTIMPYAEGRFSHISQDALRESGTSATVTQTDSIRDNYFHTRLGVEFSHDFQVSCGVITPSVNVAWRHDYGDGNTTARAMYINDPAGTAYWLYSSGIEKDSADIGVSLRTLHQIGPKTMLALNLAYNLNLSRRSNTHSIYAGVDLGF